ncbi:MAG: hypothetical protein RIQ48_704 [Pseudomonadota bacterium]|jgi:hypothetical protein
MNYYTGINNKLSFLGIPKSDIFAAFGFYSGNKVNGNSNVYPDEWAFPYSSTGNLISTTPLDFYFTGSGYFNGNSIVKFDKPFEIDNALMFISYTKTNNRDEILLSSVTGNNFNNYSGYVLGINQANKLYFKYWNPIEGPFSFTFQKTISDKNLIYIYKESSSLTIGKYNNNTFEFETESFSIFNNIFKDSNQLFLGGSFQNSIPWVNSQNFIGYIDKFYILKNNLPFYADDLARSLYSNPEIVTIDTTVDCYQSGISILSGFSYSGITGTYSSGFSVRTSGITGYTNVLSGFNYSGTTGFKQNIIGAYVDTCGSSNNIYEITPLTGLITGNIIINSGITGLIISTGNININLTGLITGQGLVFTTQSICTTGKEQQFIIDYYQDENFLKSLSYSYISLLDDNLKNNDIIEAYTKNYINKNLDYNNDLDFDSINGYYINSKNYKSGDLILFKNGQTLTNGGYSSGLSGYDIIYTPIFDYFTTGNKIYIKDSNEFDFIFYDNLSGDNNYFYLTDYKSGTVLPINTNSNSFIFQNGQKLISGLDYNKSSNGLNFNFDLTGIDPQLFLIKTIDSGFNKYITNSGSFKILNNFNHGCSLIYYNGIKQKLNNNYIENSNFDLISGNFYMDTDNFNILNSNDGFFIQK